MTGNITFSPILGCEGENAIEASIYGLDIDGDLLLLDIGFMSTQKKRPEKEESRMLNSLEKIKSLESKLAGILVSHAHLDHIGLLPHAFHLLDQVPIYMTAFTREIAKVILKDAIKVSPAYYSKSLMECYTKNKHREASDGRIIDDMLASNRIHICSFNEPTCNFQIHDTTVKALKAGHIPGAASYLITGKDNSTVLYTGDYSRTDFLTVEAAPDPSVSDIDLMITESTYGNRDESLTTRETEVQGFISQLRDILSNRGRILIPSFALGRAQEILAILLKSMKEDDTLQPYPIRVLGMARNITYLCTEDSDHRFVRAWAVENFEELFKSCMYAGCAQGLVQFPSSNYEVENALIYDNGPAIFIAPSGMLAGGWSPKIAGYLAKEPTSAILFVGYQDEESPGKRFLEITKNKLNNQPIELKVDPDKPAKRIRFACTIGQYKLSAHANAKEIIDFIKKWQPRNLYLVHGPTHKAKKALEMQIRELLPNTTIKIPEDNKSYTIKA